MDKQLQDAICQLEHKKGLVLKIDDKKNSTDLANAITSGIKIIITTIQKFPYGIGLTEEDRIIIDQYQEMFKQDKNIMDMAYSTIDFYDKFKMKYNEY